MIPNADSIGGLEFTVDKIHEETIFGNVSFRQWLQISDTSISNELPMEVRLFDFLEDFKFNFGGAVLQTKKLFELHFLNLNTDILKNYSDLRRYSKDCESRPAFGLLEGLQESC